MEAVLKTTFSNDWITGIFILILVLLSVAKVTYANRFLDFIILPFNNKYLMVYNKEQTLLHPFNILMSLIQVFSIAAFAMVAINAMHWDFFPEINNQYLLVAILIVLALTAKILVQKIIGNLFEIDQPIEQYIYKKLSYFNFSSLILYAASIIFTYVVQPTKMGLLFFLIIFVLINLIGWFITIKNYQNQILDKLFYFILYLCALEIAPYLVGFLVLSQ